jgi:spore coat protein U-like protein
MKHSKLKKVALAIGTMLAAGAVMADTDDSQLTVNATVNNNCAIGNGTLNFGTLTLAVDKTTGAAGAIAPVNEDTGATISIICTNGASATITGDLGLNAEEGTTRKMKSGSDLLPYELYTTNARDVIFNSTNSIAYTGTGAATTTVSIYGQIAGADLQSAKKGVYSDTVALTINYTP